MGCQYSVIPTNYNYPQWGFRREDGKVFICTRVLSSCHRYIYIEQHQIDRSIIDKGRFPKIPGMVPSARAEYETFQHEFMIALSNKIGRFNRNPSMWIIMQNHPHLRCRCLVHSPIDPTGVVCVIRYDARWNKMIST